MDDDTDGTPPEPTTLRLVGTGRTDSAIREQRRDLVARYHRKRMPYADIVTRCAEELGLSVSYQTVRDDVVVIKERWRQRYTASYEAHCADILADCEALLDVVMPKALEPNATMAQVEQALKILDRKMRVVGIGSAVDSHTLIVAAAATSSAAKQWDGTPADEREQRGLRILALVQAAQEAGHLPTPSTNGDTPHDDGETIDV